MTGVEIAAIATLITAAGGVLLGMFKIMSTVGVSARKTSVPPQNHGPCNESVDRLTDVIEKNVDEQRAFRELFVMWMAREEGYRNGKRITAEFPVQGG
jgi:hypothetical protein